LANAALIPRLNQQQQSFFDNGALCPCARQAQRSLHQPIVDTDGRSHGQDRGF